MHCSFCNDKVYALGLCNKHYKKFKKYGDPVAEVRPRGTLYERFWAKVDKTGASECWNWTGGFSSTGYGLIQEGGRATAMVSAHRVAYELANGPVPEGMYVLHACDNRACVNPRHLSVGTQSRNIKDAYDRGRKSSPFKEAKNRAHG